MKKKSFFSENPYVLYTKDIIFPQTAYCIFLLAFGKNYFFFPSLNIFDAFELDVNVVNFVYYGKTRISKRKFSQLFIV